MPLRLPDIPGGTRLGHSIDRRATVLALDRVHGGAIFDRGGVGGSLERRR